MSLLEELKMLYFSCTFTTVEATAGSRWFDDLTQTSPS